MVMVIPESCKLCPCPIHPNRCDPQSAESLATCFNCGKDIRDRNDLRSLGSQGYLKHPEWVLVYCAACMKPLDDWLEDCGRRWKEKQAGCSNTPVPT